MAVATRDSDQIMVRVPDGMRDRLKEAAAVNGRSLNSEINARLEAFFQSSASIHPEVARLLDQHIEAEVSSRLRKIAATIGGAA